jgi:hypothetical protein
MKLMVVVESFVRMSNYRIFAAYASWAKTTSRLLRSLVVQLSTPLKFDDGYHPDISGEGNSLLGQ